MYRQPAYSRLHDDFVGDDDCCQACCDQCDDDCFCRACRSCWCYIGRLLQCGDKSKLFAFCSLLLFTYGIINSLASFPDDVEWNPSVAARLIRGPTYLWNSSHTTSLPLDNDTIYVITPTYARPNQRSILTALAQTFYFVPTFHWIIVEDAPSLSPWIRDLLDRLSFNFTQIACHRAAYCARHSSCKGMSAKGSLSRNCGLLWLRDSGIQHGVIYFADDDNFYDVRLFDEIRATKRVSLFPVGGFLNTGVSSPIMIGGKIVDFIDPWKATRKWPIDMAGFATSLAFWRNQSYPLFTHNIGYLETKFLEAMNVTRNSVEVVCANATKIFVWHNTLGKVRCSKSNVLWKTALKVQSSNIHVLKKKIHC